MKKTINPMLFCLTMLLVFACAHSANEEKATGTYAVRGNTFHIDFSPTSRSTSPSSEQPNAITIAFNDDATGLSWTSLFGNYGMDEHYQQGNVAISTTEGADQFDVVGVVGEDTTFTVTFEANNTVSISGMIANNHIPPSAQTTVVPSIKADTLDKFHGRVYFGTQDKAYSSTAGRLVFGETQIVYHYYTNAGTTYQSDKSFAQGTYEDVTFEGNTLSFLDQPIPPLRYDPETDTFRDTFTHEEKDQDILKRIK